MQTRDINMTLKEKYLKEVVPQMVKEFGYKSSMAVPKVSKVVVNTGIGKMVVGKPGAEQTKVYETIIHDLSLITGQRPVLTKAKKSIAGFKTREGMPLGVMVTLRGKKMYDFLTRLIDIALPRSRDFRGVSVKSFDKSGNLTVAVKESIVFPEISPEKTRIIFGFEITLATTAKTEQEGERLLKLMGFPLKTVK